MSIRRICIVAALAAAAPLAAQAPPLSADSVEQGRALTRWFTQGKVDSLWSVVIPAQGGMLSSKENLAAGMAQFSERAGRVVAVLEERFIWRNGQRQFRSDLQVEGLPEPLVLRWVLRPDRRVGGMGINPASAAPPADSSGPVLKRP
jgi:hypothetical protein